MQIEHKAEFTTLLVATMAIYERQITKPVSDIFFNVLAPYSIEQVRDGICRHLQDPVTGKFSPKPSDVIAQIQGVIAGDGRPGKDEAWSIALKSLDELDTVLVTEEVLAALNVARPLLEIRDKVAARMAFVEAYERHVALARRGMGKPVKWIVSLGEAKDRRIHAIEEGVRLGRLTEQQAKPHLIRIGHETQAISAEGSAIAGLLAGPAGATPEERRERLREVRNQIGPGAGELLAEKTHREALERRADTERRKKSVLDKIQGKTAK